MKVLHLSTNDFGGAGSAAVRIHRAHLTYGFDSKMIVKNKTVNDEKDIYTYSKNRYKNFLFFFILRASNYLIRRLFIKEKYLMYSFLDLGEYGLIEEVHRIDFVPDVIVIHWVAGFVGLGDIARLKTEFGCKIFWYLMDMAPITGGCHFAWECRNYQEDCQECPAVRGPLLSRLPQYYLKKKKEIIAATGLEFIAPNVWVSSQIIQASITNSMNHIAYIPIDSKLFIPPLVGGHRNENEFCILFGTSDMSNSRKGGKYFVEAVAVLLGLIKNEAVHSTRKPVIVIPSGSPPEELSSLDIEIRCAGYASTDSALVQLYHNADVYVCCSIEDSGPMMVSEALMCGLPVVAFKVGVCPELISDGINGSLVSLRDSFGIAQELFKFLTMPETNIQQMSTNARTSILAKASHISHCKQFEMLLRD